MPICLGFFLILLKLILALANTPRNETRFDGGATIVLNFGFYQNSCPEAEPIIFSWVEKAVSDDLRMAASLLRLHFHDCFVNSGGPGWEVQMGRKDSLSASKSAANNNIPSPNPDVPTLVAKFQNVGLSLQDMVTLSGAHTMGKARCSTFSSRINGNSNSSPPDVNLEFLQSLQQLCSQSAANTTLANLDHSTPSMFDNQYYINILSGEGLLASDQVLATGDDGTRELIQTYVEEPAAFYEDFKHSMQKMGSLTSGTTGEVRRNCRAVNDF